MDVIQFCIGIFCGYIASLFFMQITISFGCAFPLIKLFKKATMSNVLFDLDKTKHQLIYTVIIDFLLIAGASYCIGLWAPQMLVLGYAEEACFSRFGSESRILSIW